MPASVAAVPDRSLLAPVANVAGLPSGSREHPFRVTGRQRDSKLLLDLRAGRDRQVESRLRVADSNFVFIEAHVGHTKTGKLAGPHPSEATEPAVRGAN